MNIAYITINDILNKNTWTKDLQGICAAGYYIAKYLVDESTSINYIGPLNKNFTVLTRAKWSFYHNILKKDYYRWAEPLVANNYAHQIKNKLITLNSNIVLCPENIVPIAYLDCKQPIVLWSDATLSSLINFYRHMDNLCNENIQNIHLMENEALNRCQLIMYTSEWAAKKAITTYNLPPSKVKVVPFGANLECNREIEDIKNIINSRINSPCKLLFIGVDWVRKGGNVALQVTKELNSMGLTTELTIVGCHPKTDELLPSFVKVIPFIDKSTSSGIKKINQLFTDTHFLILPTIADCTPHVFAEANSFGVPSLSTNVGGIASIIQENLNGKTFSPSSGISEYCNYIIALMENYRNYKELALSSFHQYQSRLNWNVAVQNAKQLMSELID
jgi:glycosyltransferase involved in cell wall biosynthesis